MSIWPAASSCSSKGSLSPISATLSRRPSPYRFRPPPTPGSPPHRPAYNFDGCTPEVLLTRMKVKDGRLVLPSGMSYRVLVLPEVETMTPQAAAQGQRAGQGRRDGGGAGAAEVAEPVELPAVRRRRCRSWRGSCGPAGQGRGPLLQAGPGDLAAGGQKSQRLRRKPPPRLGAAKWIWFKEGNPAVAAPPGKRYFRRVLSLEDGAEHRIRAHGDDGRQRVRAVGQRSPRRGRGRLHAHLSHGLRAPAQAGDKSVWRCRR